MKESRPIIHPYAFVGINYGKILQQQQAEKKSTNSEEPKKPDSKILKDFILKMVSDECNIKIEDIMSKNRFMASVDARYIYIAALRLKFNMSLADVGRNTGDRDNTSIIHALKSFDNRYETERPFRENADRVFYMLNIEYTHKFYPK
jgi:chromosomal replication initiation ATPase DnaA